MSKEIWTWGYGPHLAGVLESSQYLMSSNSMKYLIAIFLFFGLLVTLTRVAGKDRHLAWLRFLVIVAIVVKGFFTPNTQQFTVADTQSGYFKNINLAPMMGYLFALGTHLEKSTIDLFESSFSVANGAGANTIGKYPIGFSISLYDEMRQPTINNQILMMDMGSYMQECFLPNLTAQQVSTIVTSQEELPTKLFEDNPGTNGIVVLSDGGTYDCPGAATKLKSSLDIDIQSYMKNMSSMWFKTDSKVSDITTAGDNMFFSIASTTLQAKYGNSYQNIVKNRALTNYFNQSLKQISASTGDDSGMIASVQATTEVSQEMNLWTASQATMHTLPMQKAVFTCIIFGLFFIFCLMSLATASFAHIKMGLLLMASLILWGPLMAVLNFLINTEIALNVSSTALLFDPHFTVTKITKLGAFLGYVGSLIPVLAFSIVKQSEHGFVSLMQAGSNITDAASKSANSENQREKHNVSTITPDGLMSSYNFGDKTFSYTDKNGAVHSTTANLNGGGFDAGGASSSKFGSSGVTTQGMVDKSSALGTISSTFSASLSDSLKREENLATSLKEQESKVASMAKESGVNLTTELSKTLTNSSSANAKVSNSATGQHSENHSKTGEKFNGQTKTDKEHIEAGAKAEVKAGLELLGSGGSVSGSVSGGVGKESAATGGHKNSTTDAVSDATIIANSSSKELSNTNTNQNGFSFKEGTTESQKNSFKDEFSKLQELSKSYLNAHTQTQTLQSNASMADPNVIMNKFDQDLKANDWNEAKTLSAKYGISSGEELAMQAQIHSKGFLGDKTDHVGNDILHYAKGVVGLNDIEKTMSGVSSATSNVQKTLDEQYKLHPSSNLQAMMNNEAPIAFAHHSSSEVSAPHAPGAPNIPNGFTSNYGSPSGFSSPLGSTGEINPNDRGTASQLLDTVTSPLSSAYNSQFAHDLAGANVSNIAGSINDAMHPNVNPSSMMTQYVQGNGGFLPNNPTDHSGQAKAIKEAFKEMQGTSDLAAAASKTIGKKKD